MSLNNSHAPGEIEMIKISREIFKAEGYDAVMDYLTEIASNDFKCPDKCATWAENFYDENQEEIENKEISDV